MVLSLREAKGNPRFLDVPKEARTPLEKKLAVREKYNTAADERVRGVTTGPVYVSIEDVSAQTKGGQ